MRPRQGADYLECDATVTRDLRLVCSHEPWIGLVSNVANNSAGGPEHPDFSDRVRRYDMAGGDEGTYDWMEVRRGIELEEVLGFVVVMCAWLVVFRIQRTFYSNCGQFCSLTERLVQ